VASRDGAVLRLWNTPGRRISTATALVCLVVTLYASFITTGCVASTPAAEPDATLRIGVRDTDEARDVIRSFLFAEGLLAIDWQGRPIPRLASDRAWEKDGRALRVHLRSGIRFHDGTPLTAAAAVESIRQQIAKETARGFEAVDRVEAIDERTILFHLSRPDGFLPSALAGLSIVDEHTPNVGTGPFRLVADPKDPNRLEAVRNTTYYRGMPDIASIRVISYPTPRASWVGLMRGDVDMALDISKESVEFLEGAARFDRYPSIQPFYIPLVFNVRNPVLARVEVRRAIAEAIDRTEIVSQAMRKRGQAAEADDPIWPVHWAYTNRDHHAFNLSAARFRLDRAGFPVRPSAPGRRASRFQLKCMFYNVDPQFERIALLLQRQLAAAGIDLVLEGLNGAEMRARLKAGQFDTYLFQLTSGRDVSWTYRFWHSPHGALGPVMQNTGYTGADDVLDRLRQARDEDENDIRSAVADVRQRFYDDVPAIFLSWAETTRALDKRFNFGDTSDPDILGNMWRWQRASTKSASR